MKQTIYNHYELPIQNSLRYATKMMFYLTLNTYLPSVEGAAAPSPKPVDVPAPPRPPKPE